MGKCGNYSAIPLNIKLVGGLRGSVSPRDVHVNFTENSSETTPRCDVAKRGTRVETGMTMDLMGISKRQCGGAGRSRPTF